MGRITISIPDDLEAAVDARAKERGIAVSQFVAEALRAHLAPAPTQPPPPQSPSPSPPAPHGAAVKDHDARAYVSELAFQVELLRRTVEAIVNGNNIVVVSAPTPYELRPPPWPAPQP